MPRLRHLLIQGTAQPQPYVSTSRGSGKFKVPLRDEREIHGERLAEQVRQAASTVEHHPEITAEGIGFVPIAVTSDPNFKLLLDSLDNKTLGLQLVNVRSEPDGSQKATVHIPKENVTAFVKKFEAYAHETNRFNNPPNQPLAESITELRLVVSQA